MPTDEAALLLQISYDLNRLKSQGQKATGQVDHDLSAIERRAKKTAIELEETLSFRNVNAGAALTNVLGGLKEGAIDEASSKLGVFGGALGALGPIGLGAAAGVTAVGYALERSLKTAEWAEDIEHASRALGLTTTKLQQFDFIAAAAGIPVEKMRESMAGLVAQIGNVESGLARSMSVKTFTDGLKIKPEDLRGWGDLEHQLPHILDAAAKLDAEERAGLATRLKVDPDVLNSLIEMRDHLDGVTAAADQFGVMSAADVSHAADVAKQMKITGAVIDSQMRMAFVNLSPAILFAEGLVARFASGLVNLEANATLTGIAIAGLFGSMASFVSGHGFGDPMAGVKGYFARQNAAGPLPETPKPKLRVLPKPPHHKGGGGGDQTDALTNTATGDLDSADKALAEAQKALTTNIQARADLEAVAIKADADKQQAKLSKDLAELLKNDKIAGATSDLLQAKIEQAKDETEKTKNLKLQLLANQTAQAITDQSNAMARIGLEGQQAMLRAQDALGPSVAKRAQISLQLFALDEQLAEAKLQEVIASKTASDAAIAQAQAELDNLRATLPLRSQAAATNAANQIKAQQYAMAELSLQGQVDALDAEKAVGKTTEQRRQIALRLFALDEQLQELKLKEVVATTAAGSAENERAKAELANLQATLALRQQAASQANPTNSWSAWLQDAKASVRDVGEAFAKARVDGIEAFNASLFDSEGRFQGLGNAVHAFATKAIVDFEQWGLKAVEVGIFGDGQSGGLLGGLMGGKSGASGGGLLGGLFGGKGGGNKPDGTASNPLFVTMGAGGAAGGIADLFGGGQAAAGAGQAAAAGGGGILSSIIGGIGHIFGLADGGQFKVGGPAGIDRNLAVMKLTRNERVTVETEAQQRAGGGRRMGGTNIFNFPNSSVDGFKKSQRQVARTARMATEGR
jgi:hypothetical protein